MSMKTITIASAKGGVLKTSLTAMLSVRASQESPNVAMFDLNEDQGNLTQWWALRGQMDLAPRLLTDLTNIPFDAKQAERSGAEWLFIDTPPLEMDLIQQAVAIADFVLVPVRTAMFDVSAVESVTAMCRVHRVRFAFVLVAVDNRFKPLLAQTIAFLRPEGPILKSQISHRLPYIQALTQGRTGGELNKDLAEETNAIWLEVKALALQESVKGGAHV